MLLIWATNIYKHKQTWQSYGTGSAWLIHECFESLFLCYGRAGGITFATFMALLKGMVLNACLEHHTTDMGRQGQNEANFDLALRNCWCAKNGGKVCCRFVAAISPNRRRVIESMKTSVHHGGKDAAIQILTGIEHRCDI